jgi:hypothetical protein
VLQQFGITTVWYYNNLNVIVHVNYIISCVCMFPCKHGIRTDEKKKFDIYSTLSVALICGKLINVI